MTALLSFLSQPDDWRAIVLRNSRRSFSTRMSLSRYLRRDAAERGAKGIEITVLRHGREMEQLTQKVVDDLCEDIKKEDAEDDSKEDA